MRVTMGLLELLLVATAALAYDGGEYGTSPSGVQLRPAETVTVPAAVVRDVRDDIGSEAVGALRAAWGWGLITAGSGIYAGVAVAGGGGGRPELEYLSYVGVVAGIVGAVRAWMRAHDSGVIYRGLDESLSASGGAPGVALRRGTADAAGQDLHRRQASLRAASRGALRAGCVLPALMGGIGLYGLTVKGSGGDVLAGVGLGSAVVVGAPAMLTYIGLQERLKRMDRLVARWDDALLGQETTQ